MQTQYGVSGYKIGLYFHEYDLTVEVDEIGRNDTNIDYQIQRQRAIEKDVGCVFIRIDPDKKILKFWKPKMKYPDRHFKTSTRKYLIYKISKTARTRI